MDRVKEKIGYYKLFIPLLWTGVFITIGSIGWLMNNYFPMKNFFLGLLFIVVTFFVISLLFFHMRIKKLIKEL